MYTYIYSKVLDWSSQVLFYFCIFENSRISLSLFENYIYSKFRKEKVEIIKGWKKNLMFNLIFWIFLNLRNKIVKDTKDSFL